MCCGCDGPSADNPEIGLSPEVRAVCEEDGWRFDDRPVRHGGSPRKSEPCPVCGCGSLRRCRQAGDGRLWECELCGAVLAEGRDACGACCYIGDDSGDGFATVGCQREPGHPGPHREVCRGGRLRIEWDEGGEE